ncbi:MAG: rRNA (cytidine1920-2-O)/16S rRNA (cytidine1409-2-O)-methyltransferase [Actinomycetota bacterium]|jgi:23S rRNA (cytidine1920-2'-O)/16S rRNA (cytidine1409-2'-O)-methyltransferase
MARRALVEVVRRVRPDVDDPHSAIEAGEVQVDGVIVTNPKSQVRDDARIVVKHAKELKGEAKLSAGLDALERPVEIEGRVALDVGASTGGFTTELLRRGARFVYAVDAGHGQLMGSLRQDPRVKNLESTNASELSADLIPQALDVVTLDISYSPLRAIVPGITSKLRYNPGATMIALVKPMFELQAGQLPTERADLERAVNSGETALDSAGWHVDQAIESPLRGNGGAIEFFLRATLH